MLHTRMPKSSNASDLDDDFDRLLTFLFEELAADDGESSSLDILSSSDDSAYASLGIFDSCDLSKYDGNKLDIIEEDQGMGVEVIDHQDHESNALAIVRRDSQDGITSTSKNSPTIYIVMTKTHDGSSSSSIYNSIVDFHTPLHSTARAA